MVVVRQARWQLPGARRPPRGPTAATPLRYTAPMAVRALRPDWYQLSAQRGEPDPADDDRGNLGALIAALQLRVRAQSTGG